MFIYKILKFNDSPTNLVNTFKKNSQLNKRYALRNANKLTIPYKGKFNDYKEETFSYFFSQFINEVIGDFTEYKISFFKLIIKQNIKHYFNLFVNIFNKFDLDFRVYKKDIKKQKTITISIIL